MTTRNGNSESEGVRPIKWKNRGEGKGVTATETAFKEVGVRVEAAR